MAGPDPSPFSGYFRPQAQLDVRKLALLRNAYFGVYWLIASTVGIGLGVHLIGTALLEESQASEDAKLIFLLLSLGLMFVVNFFVALKYAKMVAEATGSGSGYAVYLALTSMVLAPCCVGLLGCAFIQSAATAELRRYGIRSGFLGVKKAEIDAKMAQIQSAQTPVPPMQL